MRSDIVAPVGPSATASVNRFWRYARAFAVVAAACGMLLGGLSAWFLGSVALAGLTAAAFTFNFHTPAALVRLLALGRTAAKYGERLAGHWAALSDQVARRIALFSAIALAPAVRSAGWQLGDEARLADYLDDVEDLDFARLRVSLPTLSAGVGLIAMLAATLVLVPTSLLPIALVVIITILAAAGLSRAGIRAWEQRRSLQRKGAQRLGMALASAVPLQAEGAWRGECAEALARLSEAEATDRQRNGRQAALEMLGGLIGPVGLLSVVGSAWFSGFRNDALLVPIFLGFAWMALGEALQGLSGIVVARFRREAAAAEMAKWTGADSQPVAVYAVSGQLQEIEAVHLIRRTPTGSPLGFPLTARFTAGRPTVLSGPSGCGKTSLLKQIAGWIGNDVMQINRSGQGLCRQQTTPLDRQGSCFFCPHDAAILADTVRANLFAPTVPDNRIWGALEAVELDRRIAETGGLDAWITQDQLSLGEAQRLNLARALLTDKPIVLLDEPTEHLDEIQAGRILSRLLLRLQDRIVVISSHRPFAAAGVAEIHL